MPCVLTSAISKPCGEGVSGIKKLWAVEFTALNTMTVSAGVVTAMALDATKVFFGWEVEPESWEADFEVMRSRQDGTCFFKHKINGRFNKWETTKKNELLIVAKSDLAIIFLDNNGLYWLMGRSNGMTMVTGAGKIGKEMGSFNGFEFAFEGPEPDAPVEVNSSVVTSLALT